MAVTGNPTLRLIGNVLWVAPGGFVMAVLWCCAGVLCALSLIGIPWVRGCFNIALFVLWPFGRVAISRQVLTGQDDIGTGIWGLIGNAIWLVLLGIWLALAHVALALICAITIIGIPFAWQHLKLAGVALAPIGVAIVDAPVAEEARRRAAAAELDRMRGYTNPR